MCVQIDRMPKRDPTLSCAAATHITYTCCNTHHMLQHMLQHTLSCAAATHIRRCNTCCNTNHSLHSLALRQHTSHHCNASCNTHDLLHCLALLLYTLQPHMPRLSTKRERERAGERERERKRKRNKDIARDIEKASYLTRDHTTLCHERKLSVTTFVTRDRTTL